MTVWSRPMAEGAAPADFEALAARARLGDRDAYALLYQRYYGPITRVARASLPPDAVEDAVAETFVRAWAALPRYRTTGVPFAAWLYAISRGCPSARRAAGTAYSGSPSPSSSPFSSSRGSPTRARQTWSNESAPR